MKFLTNTFRIVTEGVAALMMAAIFLTFVLQIGVRYVVGSEWFVAIFGNLVDAANFGWTVEFILVLWQCVHRPGSGSCHFRHHLQHSRQTYPHRVGHRRGIDHHGCPLVLNHAQL